MLLHVDHEQPKKGVKETISFTVITKDKIDRIANEVTKC